MYLRTIDKQMDMNWGGQTRWGDADTYDRSKTEYRGEYNDQGRNATRVTFRNRHNINYRCVNNCAELDVEIDYMGDSDGNCDNSYYQRDHPLSQLNFTGRNSSSIGLGFGDIGNWQTDNEIGNYSVNRIVANGPGGVRRLRCFRKIRRG